MTLPRMPWRIMAALTSLGVAAGVIFGFIRGLSYLPTLPVALIEGGALFGIPAALLGLLLVGAWSLGSAIRRPRA